MDRRTFMTAAAAVVAVPSTVTASDSPVLADMHDTVTARWQASRVRTRCLFPGMDEFKDIDSTTFNFRDGQVASFGFQLSNWLTDAELRRFWNGLWGDVLYVVSITGDVCTANLTPIHGVTLDRNNRIIEIHGDRTNLNKWLCCYETPFGDMRPKFEQDKAREYPSYAYAFRALTRAWEIVHGSGKQTA